MMKKSNHFVLLNWLYPTAQAALGCALLLSNLQDPKLDFLIGFLVGFSITVNLAYLYWVAKTTNLC